MKSTHAVCSAVALLLSACTLYEIHPGVEIVAGRDASDHCGMRDVGLSSDCPATSCLALQKAAPKEAAQRSTPKRQRGARRNGPTQHKEPGAAPRQKLPAGTQPAVPRPAAVQPAGAPQRRLGPARSPWAEAEPDRTGQYREREPQPSPGSPMPPSAWPELQAEAPAQFPRSAPPEPPSQRPGLPRSAHQAAGARRGPSAGATAAALHGAPGPCPFCCSRMRCFTAVNWRNIAATCFFDSSKSLRASQSSACASCIRRGWPGNPPRRKGSVSEAAASFSSSVGRFVVHGLI